MADVRARAAESKFDPDSNILVVPSRPRVPIVGTEEITFRTRQWGLCKIGIAPQSPLSRFLWRPGELPPTKRTRGWLISVDRPSHGSLDARRNISMPSNSPQKSTLRFERSPSMAKPAVSGLLSIDVTRIFCSFYGRPDFSIDIQSFAITYACAAGFWLVTYLEQKR